MYRDFNFLKNGIIIIIEARREDMYLSNSLLVNWVSKDAPTLPLLLPLPFFLTLIYLFFSSLKSMNQNQPRQKPHILELNPKISFKSNNKVQSSF